MAYGLKPGVAPQLLNMRPITRHALYIAESGQWFCERDENVMPLHDGDVISHGQQQWQFCCAETIDMTPVLTEQRGELSTDIAFHFDVSLDEEHILLKLIQGDTKLDLGERVHHYLLLTLARQRLDDIRHQVDVNEQGWLDLEALSQMLNLDPAHLNIQIHRARKQIAKLDLQLPYTSDRAPCGKHTFWLSLFHITRGAEDEGTLLPAMGTPETR
ncbi:hypothetical protein C2W62_34405 [Candidatus Entotheonella serta]|nr:hypothetical protein C2W62_34405 [Candidatus Entotheonella serta]